MATPPTAAKAKAGTPNMTVLEAPDALEVVAAAEETAEEATEAMDEVPEAAAEDTEEAVDEIAVVELDRSVSFNPASDTMCGWGRCLSCHTGCRSGKDAR